MDNITTLPTTKTLTIGERIGDLGFTVLAASVKYPMSEGTRTAWVALLHKPYDKIAPFTTHLVVDTDTGWELVSGWYFANISDALANFIERGGEVG